MRTYKLTLSEETLALVNRYVAGLALVNEEKAAELLDEEGEVDVEAVLDSLTSPTPHFISRPLALLNAACKAAVVAGKVTPAAYAEVFPEPPPAERKAKRGPMAPSAAEVDALSIPKGGKAPVGPKVPAPALTAGQRAQKVTDAALASATPPKALKPPKTPRKPKAPKVEAPATPPAAQGALL